MTIVFVWCNCATPPFCRHYYTGERCPFSGWIAPHVTDVLKAVKRVEGSGIALTIKTLTDAGLTLEAAERVMIAEFPDRADVPFALGVGSFGEDPASILTLGKDTKPGPHAG